MELKDYYGFLLITLVSIIIFDNYIELSKISSQEEAKAIKPAAISNIVMATIFLFLATIIYALSINIKLS